MKVKLLLRAFIVWCLLSNIPQVGYSMYGWAENQLKKMSLEEKIGQLIMLPAYSNMSVNYENDLENLVRQYHVGGLVFFQGNAKRQVDLTNRFQKASGIPLLIGMDAEWGLSMRLDGIDPFPRSMTLGAIHDTRYIYNLGAEIARQCRLMGVHLNFAPVLDVNNNSSNPVINTRSFGENPERVAILGQAYIKGLQDNGIMAVGKHFPGHGDTDTDSHHSLPMIYKDRNQLESVEFIPFRAAIQAGLDGLMVAHLYVPELEDQENWPSSLSRHIVNNLLQDKMGFEGLIFTDAMNMKAVSDLLPHGEAEVAAFLAGNDILLMPVNVQPVIEAFMKAIRNKKISMKELDRRVLKMLRMKEKYVLPYITHDIEFPKLQWLNKNTGSFDEDLFKKAVTIARDSNGLLPFRQIEKRSLASLSIQCGDEFQEYLDHYADFEHFDWNQKINEEDLLSMMAQYDIVVAGLAGVSYYPGRNYGISQKHIDFLRKLNRQTQVVLVIFGNPYSLRYFDDIGTLICGYEGLRASYKVVPQVLFGALSAEGTLPVTATSTLQEGTGIHYPALGRLSFGDPKKLGFLENGLSLIDSVIIESVKGRDMPGGKILVARKGTIVYEKSFGYHTYDSVIKVSNTSVFDLASVTKVIGSVQALMMLYEEGKLDLDKKISYYLPSLKGTNKEDMIIRDILTHQAGLYPYMPYWKYTLKRFNRENNYYRFQKENGYEIEITDKLFGRNDLPDTIWNWMAHSELVEKEDSLKPYEYRYSDMGFYLIQKLIDTLANQSIDQYLGAFLYDPLMLKSLGFTPKKRMAADRIVPSTIDGYFRDGKIQGNVNDEIGAIYGGVAGHAGLFSNAYDLAVLLQMNLQCGYYGGEQYFQPETIAEFTRRQYGRNRRGLGWDKPQLIGDEYNPASFLASENSYGHSGFTGTFVWMDPDYDLIYIFLSNRTYPDQENRKLIDEDVRKRIQTIIYSSIINQ
jgi:beta-glucosidase-like glycosyl hydrolase/CubicO group peptidase (beta-lactamase class C family)